MALTRSEIMARIGRRDTKPELAVRAIVRSLGIGYRVDVVALPGRPDIACRRAKWAVFVHGCFWHRHDCRARLPRTNQAWWRAKLTRNQERDAAARRALRRQGYRVLTVWECQLREPERVRQRLATFFWRLGYET